jgi:hypothetical protein
MAHFARINENNIVDEIIVIGNEDCQNLDFPESESVGQEFITSIGLSGNWKQTSYNANFRKKYAGIGDTFDETRDAFITSKPFTSWILNEDTCVWESPIERPSNGKFYRWNEDEQSWEEVITE